MTLRNVRNFIFAIGLITLVMVFGNASVNNQLRNALTTVVELTTLQEVVTAIDQIEGAMEEERIVVGQYQLSGSEDLLTRFEEAQATYNQNWNVIVENQTADQENVISEISAARDIYKGMLDDVIDTYQSNPANNDSAVKLSSAITYYLQNLDPLFSSYAEPLIETFTAQVEIEAEKARQAQTRNQIVAIVGSSLSIGGVIMTFVYAFGMQRVLNSVMGIISSANSISRGDLDVPIDVGQPGEVGELADAIERMRTSLKAAIERLRR